MHGRWIWENDKTRTIKNQTRHWLMVPSFLSFPISNLSIRYPTLLGTIFLTLRGQTWENMIDQYSTSQKCPSCKTTGLHHRPRGISTFLFLPNVIFLSLSSIFYPKRTCRLYIEVLQYKKVWKGNAMKSIGREDNLR